MSANPFSSTWAKAIVLAAAAGCLVALWRRGSRSPEADLESAAVETEVSVQVEPIVRQTLRQYVTGFGIVEPEPGSSGKPAAAARISAPLAGVVKEVQCFEGQPVAQGQTLFSVETRRGGAAVEWTKIAAPFAGTVVYVNVRAGEVTDPESPTVLVELVDLRRLIVAAHLSASQLAEVKAGQLVEIFPQAARVRDMFNEPPSGTETVEPPAVTGAVVLVENRVDPKTDMGIVDISAPAEARLRPGQFAKVHIVTDERRDCLTVPSRSLVKNEAGEWVISLVSGKQAVQSPVRVGFQEGDRVQIQSLLLKAGDRVVTTGAYGLPEKTKIRIVNE